jgi:microcompartment protein CcmK/EutM
MQLARVVGRIVSTVKNEGLTGQRLLVIQPITPEMQDAGKQLIATDCMGAGAGEIVYWCRGRESSFPFLPVEVQTDCNIVGIVDEMRVNRQKRANS